MRVHSAFALLAPLVSLSTHAFPFPSAKEANLCGARFNIGSGFGRVEMVTRSAACHDHTTLILRCEYRLPVRQGYRDAFYECDRNNYCFPVAVGTVGTPKTLEDSDAGCSVENHPAGVKGNAKTNNHACSAGLMIGPKPIVVLSSITADNPAYASSLTDCSVRKSGTTEMIYESSPCEKLSHRLTLAAHTTYQACIYTAVALVYTYP
ncbi:hypothetical protein EG328_007508 [Venturia inaequalis]|uniref:Uncharacterized protein n=1 Tax=Venturia inaequalis TaxID=5025 RepID=A0A8H3YPH3_VENIN|nr:hypothetical protein EG328_007508 [Venturia inaequalis]